MSTHQFRRNLRRIVANKNDTQRGLAARIGISRNYLSLLTAAGSTVEPGLSLVLAVSDATGYSVRSLLSPTLRRSARKPYSLLRFAQALDDTLSRGEWGYRRTIAAKAGVTEVYLSQLTRPARDLSQPVRDPSLRVAIRLSRAVGLDIDTMCRWVPALAESTS